MAELDLPFQLVSAVISAHVSSPRMDFIFQTCLSAARWVLVSELHSSMAGAPSKCFQPGSDVQILRDHLPDQIDALGNVFLKRHEK